MTRKNPDNKPLRIVRNGRRVLSRGHEYANVISNLVIAQAQLVRAGKDSAMPHFIACVKELERLYGFHFEIHDPISVSDETSNPSD